MEYTSLNINKNDTLPDIVNLTNESLRTSILKADIYIVPTKWQKSTFPESLHEKLEVLNDGFPTDHFKPDWSIEKKKSSQNKLKIIYVSRGLDYTRGVDRLSEVLNLIEERELPIECTVIADDRRVYDDNKTNERMRTAIAKVTTTSSNLKYIKQLPYNEYIEKLHESDMHIYLSRPFVLSWSFIESSLLGSRIISIDNPSTLEVTHSNHLNLQSVEKAMQTLESYCSNSIEPLRKSKLNWTHTSEYIHYSYIHSTKYYINKLVALFF